MTTTFAENQHPGPVRPTERALAPDLTRGAMLLFIALANAGDDKNDSKKTAANASGKAAEPSASAAGGAE